MLLLSYFLDDVEGCAAEFGNLAPLLCCNHFLREEVAAHPDTGYSGLEPSLEVLFCRFHTSCHHYLAPRHRGTQTLHECRAENVSRENLAKVASKFLSLANL